MIINGTLLLNHGVLLKVLGKTENGNYVIEYQNDGERDIVTAFWLSYSKPYINW